jgi:tellurium resistance protein TerD
MAVVLSKGGSVSLTKEAGPRGLTSLTVGLGWDAGTPGGAPFDLDASALVVDANRRVLSDEHFVYYNNLQSPERGVTHAGDNLDGQGDGDDEQLRIELLDLQANAQSIVFVVSIHEADARGQSFGQVSNAFIRVVNNLDQQELARFDLSDGASSEKAIVFGEVYRDGGEWKFRALGDGHAAGFLGILRDYGVNV